MKPLAWLLLLPVAAVAQEKTPYQLQLTGGIKQNIFENTRRQITAFNVDASYSERQIRPEVSNTISFFAGLQGRKALNKRFGLVHSAGLDMQQLNITSGFRKIAGTTSQLTAYGQDYHQELLPRLQLDFGVSYTLTAAKHSELSLAVLGGQMIGLSSIANTYSYVGSQVQYNGRKTSIFFKGSLAPYDINFKNEARYVGNKGAEVITAKYAYRIYELSLGAGYHL